MIFDKIQLNKSLVLIDADTEKRYKVKEILFDLNSIKNKEKQLVFLYSNKRNKISTIGIYFSFLNSSKFFLSTLYWLNNSSSSASPSLKNCNSTSVSSRSVFKSSKDFTQDFLFLIDFKTTSAFFGSFQNSGSWVTSSSSLISSLFSSMSKVPP